MTPSETNPDAAEAPLDLEWDAFRYVSGEMLPDEHAAFETRLADDVEAAEAVVEAVRLSQAIAAAGSRPVCPGVAPAVARSRRGWLVAGVACSLAAAFALGDRFARDRDVPPASGTSPVAATGNAGTSIPDRHAEIGDLLDLWVTGDSLPARGIGGPDDADGDGDDLDGIVAAVGGPRDLARAPLDVPGWMLAAVEEGTPPRVEPVPDDASPRDN
jgi:hypothetical protein